ncbi:glycoside hydrolase family 6 protein [Streptomyces minutiscleroticus]|uniref:Glucanase n=1 Tax=Streptomyces minutiscleroticus TaxID=68238 RepID=A0A918NSY0_9ACTN|nr:glycoside hydrolase family 6 protein [Streptomyces minutiscleroticus]GGX92793.1 glucanase [Streptomyces minutiscleroticus]
MVAVASAVVVAGTAAGTLSAVDRPHGDEARPEVTRSPLLEPAPAPSAPKTRPATASAAPSPSGTKAAPTPSPAGTKATGSPGAAPAPASGALYRHADSQVLDWVRAHPGDPRRRVVESRIAAHPAAVWFTDPSPSAVASQVRAVTSAAAAQGRVPTVVAYAVPGRDCGGASEGGAADLGAYDAWIDAFAGGLGSGEVIVILEPDAIAQSDCLPDGERADRFASLARAGRVLKEADPRARVYHDAGHSAWNSPEQQARLLRQAGAASPASSDGIFSNVSNFHRTEAEIAYDRRVLDALGGPAGLGAVIDTSRNGSGAPADGAWCDPAGRSLGRAPTLRTGEARIDAYLWVKLPGESDGCRGEPGTFSADYAYDLAR